MKKFVVLKKMKNHLAFACALVGVLFLGSCTLRTLPEVWRKDVGRSMLKFFGNDSMANRIFYSSKQKLFMLDAKTGNVNWSKVYSKIHPKLKTVDLVYPLWENGVLLVYDANSRILSGVDINYGELLWVNDNFKKLYRDNIIYMPYHEFFAIGFTDAILFLDAKTGKEKWMIPTLKSEIGKYLYIPEKSCLTLVNLNYPDFYGSPKEQQIMCINLEDGEVSWKTKFLWKIETEKVTGYPIVNLWYEQDKIILTMNNLKVFDLATGQLLLSAPYYEETSALITPHQQQGLTYDVYQGVPPPKIVNNYIYVVEFKNKSRQYIKKYDLTTGELVWSTEELEDVTFLPRIDIVDNKVLLQIGGKVEIQKKTPNQIKIEFKWYGPFAVAVLDDSTGKILWRTQNLDNRITELINVDENVYFASGKYLFSVNLENGQINYRIPLKISKPIKLIRRNDNLILVFENGLLSYKLRDGSLNWSLPFKTKAFTSTYYIDFKQYENILVMFMMNNFVRVFDIDQGKELGYAYLYKHALSRDGSNLISYEFGRIINFKLK